MKKYYALILMLFLLYIPSACYADEIGDFSFAVDSLDRIVSASGNEATIKIMLYTKNTDHAITGCEFKATASDNVQIISLTGKNGWETEQGQLYSLRSNTGLVSTSSDTEASVVIGNMVVKVNGESRVTFSEIKCYAASNDSSGTQSDVSIDFGVTSPDKPVVRMDGSIISGNFYDVPSTKDSFTLSVSSNNADTLSNATVKALNTVSGNEKILCSSEQISNCTINFISDNFCITGEECAGVYSDSRDVIMILISSPDNKFTNRTIYVAKKLGDGEIFYNDSTISSLRVYGVDITLTPGQTIYDITVPSDLPEYKVEATLSDPEHYTWDGENNPSKYVYPIDTVILLVVPKDEMLLGGSTSVYTINVSFDGGGVSSEASSSSVVKPSSSSVDGNPHTGGFATIIVAIMLFTALIISLRTYNNGLE